MVTVVIWTSCKEIKLLASERSERAQLCSCSIEISDTYIYVAVRQPLRACPDIIARKRP